MVLASISLYFFFSDVKKLNSFANVLVNDFPVYCIRLFGAAYPQPHVDKKASDLFPEMFALTKKIKATNAMNSSETLLVITKAGDAIFIGVVEV